MAVKLCGLEGNHGPGRQQCQPTSR